MTPEETFRILTHALDQILGAGYIVTGELDIVMPKMKGLIQSEAIGTVGPVNTFKISSKKIPQITIQNHGVPDLVIPGQVSGPACVICGHCSFIRSGTCLTCAGCGASQGCS